MPPRADDRRQVAPSPSSTAFVHVAPNSHRSAAKELQNGDENGLKAYFKFLAVKHPKSFTIILATDNATARHTQ